MRRVGTMVLRDMAERMTVVWSVRCRGGVVAGILLGGLALASTGCGVSVVGHWDCVRAEPSRDLFCVDDAVFERDGRYAATITLEGRTRRETGTYRFNGFKLRFRPASGGHHEYNAMRQGGRLTIKREDARATLRKVKPSEDDSGREKDE